MKKVLYDAETMKVPVKMWLNDVETGATEQIVNLSNLPFVYRHVAIMPDCHQGYGMPIGGVLATKGVVIPNAVGVDIGCGMCAVKTTIKAERMTKEQLTKIIDEILKVIPVGFGHHKEQQNDYLMPALSPDVWSIVKTEFNNALTQLGTLGGGNHFIEIQKDKENNVWIMIHSGSRNLGYKVAQYYNDLAIKLNAQWRSSVPKEWELAFLPIESKEAHQYIEEMEYCVDFALANRKLMMDRILSLLFNIIDGHWKAEPIINIAHNYAVWENHFGQDVIVHRKGATLARTGTIGIIPGSQGSKSYIVEGLGNPESFMSCSHGAGRKMGRKQAIRELNFKDEVAKMEAMGIVHGIKKQEDLQEAAGSYKDIDAVMENQKDLVKIVTELTPMAVIKGD